MTDLERAELIKTLTSRSKTKHKKLINLLVKDNHRSGSVYTVQGRVKRSQLLRILGINQTALKSILSDLAGLIPEWAPEGYLFDEED